MNKEKFKKNLKSKKEAKVKEVKIRSRICKKVKRIQNWNRRKIKKKGIKRIQN